MRKILGIYADRNRLQVFLALLAFSLCSYWTLQPQGFHLLDGINLVLVITLSPVVEIGFPFNSSAGMTEVLFLLFNSFLPIFLLVVFTRLGAVFMASSMFFWLAYACQCWFRFFWITVYRIPALIALVLAMFLLFTGLLKCLKSSEGQGSEAFSDSFVEIEKLEKNGVTSDEDK